MNQLTNRNKTMRIIDDQEFYDITAQVLPFAFSKYLSVRPRMTDEEKYITEGLELTEGVTVFIREFGLDRWESITKA